MNATDVLIIGGGISGLSTAWWLAQSGLSVEVWESAERPGGKIQSHQQDGYLTEQAASMIMNFRPEIVDLVKAAGLEAKKTARSAADENPNKLGTDGYAARTRIIELGANYVSPPGYDSFGAEPFYDAYGMKSRD